MVLYHLTNTSIYLLWSFTILRTLLYTCYGPLPSYEHFYILAMVLYNLQSCDTLLCSAVSGGERRRKDSGSPVVINSSLFRGKVRATWSRQFTSIHCRGLRIRKVSSPFPNFYFSCSTKRGLFTCNFAEYCNVMFIISLHITFYARSAQ